MYECDLIYWNLISFGVWIWHWKTAELFDFCITFSEYDLFEILRLFADLILLSTTRYLLINLSLLQSSVFEKHLCVHVIMIIERFSETSFHNLRKIPLFSLPWFSQKKGHSEFVQLVEYIIIILVRCSAFTWRLLSKRQILAYVVNKTRAGQ